MRSILALLAIVSVLSLPTVWAAPLPRSTPEAEGISSAAILDFVSAADARVGDMHSFMLVRNGKVVAEGWWSPYAADVPHMMFSLSKSFTSSAVGMAVAEGRLSVDDEVLEVFPDEAPAEPGANLKALRVKDLLTMSTGQHGEALGAIRILGGRDLVRTFLASPIEHKPGTFFLYNTPATYMQSAIVQKVTGQTVLDYLRPRLFEPLGIENPRWGTSPDGVTLGGTGLSVRTEDIAKFGQLYLQNGEWNGRQLIARDWVAAATSKQVSNGSNPHSDWDQGYGYQFWRCRHGFYRGDGAFGQFCIVMPQHETVVAITAGTRDMGLVMNLLWDKLLPGIQPAPLPADESTHRRLVARLGSLTIPVQPGTPAPPQVPPARVYRFERNGQNIASVSLEREETQDTLILGAAGQEYRIAVGRGEWLRGRTQLAGALDQTTIEPGDQPVAASGAWLDDQTYAARLCFYQTPMIVQFALRFDGDEVTLDVGYNVAFGPTTRPALTGRSD